ncbi:hypothetical protein GCM10007425_27350 [Lysinibacillus alkalisoli]|uniref:SAM-dependent methyltransferase n=1 Tax=Lysinibacillus alkalisoli TaxID=1911548 RepID=A0A917G9M1_9BACI|nr:class I SAM-dependent methyltransferase [Lysinibacillus alkalisoli]GGG31241.1 hypothetical protein GCM10007425_27350 [Lysinibacillus alkalisoli]
MQPITIVTTAGRPDERSLALAAFVCEQLHIVYEPRRKRAITTMAKQLHAHIIVAGKDRFAYYPLSAIEPFFFHPNSAAFRLKRVARGETDPFLVATQLSKGETLLDCTLGLAADAMLGAYQVGDTGRVIGLEGNRNVAFIVKQGLQQYDVTTLPLTACMRRIEVIHAQAIDYLLMLPDNSFDVVYMDPMFEETIEEATNFTTLRHAGVQAGLTEQWVQHAVRVAKKRVVLKAHFRSTWFASYGFQQMTRTTAKFHYGVIEKERRDEGLL